MPDFHTIQSHLDTIGYPGKLHALFCRVLNWGRLVGNDQPLPACGANDEDLTAQPVAQLGGIPVFRVDWPAAKLPTITQRRKLYKLLSQVALEHILCYISRDGQRLAIVWAREREKQRVELRTLTYETGTPARTTIERLETLGFTLDELATTGEIAAATVLDRINQAFDVEAVTRQFFTRYRACFEAVEQGISGLQDSNARRLFCQRLFNRLMFIVFLERKGWLTFDGRKDYLRTLWHAHQQERNNEPQANFYQSRLRLLFFAGLNTSNEVNVIDINPNGVITARIGLVPYLNGGLFEEENDDKNPAIVVPDAVLEEVITDLFYTFNFTVSESTPFDIEVAVDPEMLGKIFEELVTGRHESGSYYTPRAVVAFMCREALKGYLATHLPDESTETITCFVDEHHADVLHNPEAALDALRSIRICDPACGSGAYLLGMLQELLTLRFALFIARNVDSRTMYQRKLEIIQSNLYGVDLDPFAVNIARLRLWLSLVVEDYQDDASPLPLPNLDYKLEVGDSLTAPDPSGGFQLNMFRQQQISDYLQLKKDYLNAHSGEKLALRQHIQTKQHEIAAWVREANGGINGFDWQVAFAEVFAAGGFDVVLANPPYVRQELIEKNIKATFKRIYPGVYTGAADLYVYFYARALQMLKQEGMLVFISSNKWFRSSYGKKLRQHLAETTRIRSITDFGDLPVFGATAYPVIFVGQKSFVDGITRSILFTRVESLAHPYPDVRAVVQEQGQQLPTEAVNGADWYLDSAANVRLIHKLRRAGEPLGDYVGGHFYYGIKTGLNEAFVIDRATRDYLIAEDTHSAEVLKPFLRGRDIKRWQVNAQDLWLILARRGINIKEYPAIHAHLQIYEEQLKNRTAGNYEWYELQASPGDTKRFEQPKIVYPDISRVPRFAFDTTHSFTGDTTFLIPTNNLYLLGVLNSKIIAFFFIGIVSQVRGGYLRFKSQYVSQIPIPTAPTPERKAIETLVQQCIDAQGQSTKIAGWEVEIDARVARLYGLTPEEIEIVNR
jgi:hypothetical protein